MYLSTKTVIKDGKQVTIRIKAINWDGTRYAIVEDGKEIFIGTWEYINRKYNEF